MSSRKSSFDMLTGDQEKEEEGSSNVWAEDVCVQVGDEEPDGRWINFSTLWTYMGPGWLMSIAYLDPGNLEADLQAGAYANYQLLWVLFWCTAIGLLLQVLAARLGVVTGRNLAQVCREEYTPGTTVLLWVMTELAIIGSDIQEVVGGAIALKILFNLSLEVGTVIMALSTFLLLGLQRFGIRKIEAVFAVLILIMIVAFWASMFIAKPNSADLIDGVLEPKVSDYAVTQAVGILGAVIMPHNIYLHSALVTSRTLDRTNERKVAESIKYNSIESSLALFVSFLINLAVVATFATSFFAENCAQLDSGSQACVPIAVSIETSGGNVTCPTPTGSTGRFVCDDIGLNNAGLALEKLFPGTQAAKYIWGVGLLAAGQASTITGTFAGQFVMAGFLNLKIKAWQRMFFTRMVALGPAVLVAYLTAQNPTTSDIANEWLNVLQSLQLPFALMPVLHLTSQRKFMGKFANGPVILLSCWFLTLVVVVINVYLVVTQLQDESTAVKVVFGVFGVFYFGFLLLIVRTDLQQLRAFLCGGGEPQGGLLGEAAGEAADDHYSPLADSEAATASK